jgi:putative ABC transport system permease protein
VAQIGYFAVGRLREGVTLAQARTEMTTIAARLAKAYPDSNTAVSVDLNPLKENVVRGIRPALWILMAAVASVLLIACANVANLLLVKAGARQREMAIRQALGASRMRIVMQTVGESLPLAALGGGLGLLLSLAATKGLVAFIPPGSIPSEAVIRTDFRVLLFTGALALVTAVFFSVLPAIQISGTQPGQCLHEESRTATGGARQQRVRQGLIVAEIALALTLLAGAGLLLKSLRQMADVELGFRSDHVLHMQLTLSEARFPQLEQPGQFFSQVLEGLRQIPGVKAVGGNATLPFCGNNFGMPFVPEGRSYATLQELPGTSYNLVMGDYFKVMGIAFRSGRAFLPQDTRHSEPVVIINETLASRYFGLKDPIGKRVMLGLPDNLNREGVLGTRRLDFPWHTIVGVVADVKQYDFGAPAGPQVYLPFDQAPDFVGFRMGMMPVMLTEGDPALLSGAARTVVRGLDRDLPIARLDPLSALVRNAMERPRFAMTLLGVFAVLALVLACVGIYGVVSYGVEQRRRELGVRLALGAEQLVIVGLVLRQSLRTVGIGLAAGLIGILILNRFLESVLFQVSATDPTTVILTCGLLAMVALVASVIPAWKAAQTDPARVLHCE